MCASAAGAEEELGLITLEPGHFHAALFQKEMLPGISERVHVYAPLGPDLIAHLNRIAQYNGRAENPTHWQLEVHTGGQPLERVLREHPGEIVVLSGNNHGKIGRIDALIRAGLHVLADKPWILESEELPRLAAALEDAEQRRVVAYDAMTQRFDAPRILQRILVNDRSIFGERISGNQAEPAVRMESLHYMMKEVSGAANLRPAWFFDIRQQGEALTDVGTHLVDLVQWTLFPDQDIDYHADVRIGSASRWPTILTLAQFQAVTGEAAFPVYLNDVMKEGRLEYYGNNTVNYALRGIHVRVEARWNVQPTGGASDAELAMFRGSRARIELRQGKAEKYRPEVYIIANRVDDRPGLIDALRRKVEALQADWPGMALAEEDGGWRLMIPERLRSGHEAHFALLTARFLEYVRKPGALPAWEKSNMLAKYYITTRGVELARQSRQDARPQGMGQ